MSEFLFTVPQKYATEPHPVGATPDDVVMIEADDLMQAQDRANLAMGSAWATILPPGLPNRDEIVATYYPGRLIPVEPPAAMVFEVTETYTHSISVTIADLEGFFGAGWVQRVDIPDLWPDLGNETDGLGWQLLERIQSVDSMVKAGAMVDARVDLERNRDGGNPNVVHIEVEEGGL